MGTKWIFILLFLVAGVFAPVLFAPFVFFDDTIHITGNSWLIGGAVGNFWREPFFGLYIPVAYTIWSFLYAITPAPWIFHAFSWSLHVVNSLLVFVLIGRVFPKLGDKATGVAALVFALHGLQVEPVAWISAGRDLIAGFFCLGALLSISRVPILRWQDVLAGTMFFILALLSKPSVAPLPIAALVLFYLTCGGLDRARAITFFVWLIMAVTVVFKTVGIQSEFNSYRLVEVPLWWRLPVAVDALGFYISKFIWPWPMSLDYGRGPEAVMNSRAWLWMGALTLVAATLIFWMARKMGRGFASGFIFAVIMLSPVLGFMPFSAQIFTTVSDRYMYLPLVGISLSTAGLLGRFPKALVFVVAFVLLQAVASFSQSRIWQSNESLFTHVLKANPKSYVALNGLGLTHLNDNQLDEAERLFLAAWSLESKLAIAPANLAHLYWATDRAEELIQKLDPYISNLENVRHNRHETRALSTLYLNLGRAQWRAKNWDKAHIYLCNYAFLEQARPAAGDEVKRYLADYSRQTGKPAECAN